MTSQAEALQLWDQAQRTMRREFGEQQFRRYIEVVHLIPPVDEGGSDMRLMVPNEDVASWFNTEASELLQSMIGDRLRPGKLIIEISNQPDLFFGPESAPPPRSGNGQAKAARPAPVSARPAAGHAVANGAPKPARPVRRGVDKRTGLSDFFKIENFFSGPSNEIALAAGLKLATEEGAAAKVSPLYIHGSVGLGKSHLAHAIGNRFQEVRPEARVRLLSGEQFMREVQDAFTNNRVKEFRQRFRLLDMLIIDDIQMIGRDSEQTHKQYLGLFNYMDERELPIVMTSDRPSVRLKSNLPARLVSRISMGVDVTIGVPDLETRIGVLCYQAKSRFQIDLDRETARLVAGQLRHNCRELVGALRRMGLRSELDGIPINLATARRVLSDLTATTPDHTPREIIERTAKHFKLRPADLLSKRRSRQLVQARHVGMYLCRELTQVSLPAIGSSFGCHHTSVLHACKKIEDALHKDSDLEYDVTVLRQELAS